METVDNLGRGLEEVAKQNHPLLLRVLKGKRVKGRKGKKVKRGEKEGDKRDLDELLKFIQGEEENQAVNENSRNNKKAVKLNKQKLLLSFC